MNFIDSIDEEKTVLNGKAVCSQYRPLVEKRIKMLMASPLSSASVIKFTGGTKSYNSFENKLIERIAWNDDQITHFISNFLSLERIDKMSGLYLKLKYIYDKSDIEIAKKMPEIYSVEEMKGLTGLHDQEIHKLSKHSLKNSIV